MAIKKIILCCKVKNKFIMFASWPQIKYFVKLKQRTNEEIKNEALEFLKNLTKKPKEKNEVKLKAEHKRPDIGVKKKLKIILL